MGSPSWQGGGAGIPRAGHSDETGRAGRAHLVAHDLGGQVSHRLDLEGRPIFAHAGVGVVVLGHGDAHETDLVEEGDLGLSQQLQFDGFERA